MTGYQSRAEHMRSPRMANVMQAVAVDYGVGTRPIAIRRIDLDDPDVASLADRLMRAIADRARWRQAFDEVRRAAAGQPPPDLATNQAA